jgi:hypothetical protein
MVTCTSRSRQRVRHAALESKHSSAVTKVQSASTEAYPYPSLRRYLYCLCCTPSSTKASKQSAEQVLACDLSPARPRSLARLVRIASRGPCRPWPPPPAPPPRPDLPRRPPLCDTTTQQSAPHKTYADCCWGASGVGCTCRSCRYSTRLWFILDHEADLGQPAAVRAFPQTPLPVRYAVRAQCVFLQGGACKPGNARSLAPVSYAFYPWIATVFQGYIVHTPVSKGINTRSLAHQRSASSAAMAPEPALVIACECVRARPPDHPKTR